MRSSGSTRSRRASPSVRLLIVLVGEDHPKACTGRRLVRRGLAMRVGSIAALTPAPVVLDPYSATPVSRTDATQARRGGIVAIDCSWNRLADRGHLPVASGAPAPRARHRRLPLLIATNPQHFGRPAQLNTVEALAASLYLVGRPDEASRVVEGFHGGPTFLEVNAERLAAYAAAENADEVRAAEQRLFGGPTAGGA